MLAASPNVISVLYRHPEFAHRVLAAVSVKMHQQGTTAKVVTWFREGNPTQDHIPVSQVSDRMWKAVVPHPRISMNMEIETNNLRELPDAIMKIYSRELIACVEDGVRIPSTLASLGLPK